MKIHVKLNAHCQIKRTSFPGAGAFNLTNVHLLFQVSVYVTRGDDKWIYYHYGYPIYCHPAGFHRDFYLILAQLIDNGLCRECE
ncbi:MAG: hypothetical protein PHY82_10420, partial [Lentisphaeria bacterium]|nr:hypothetical protein [Lentisphaeria bacterium]